MSDDPRELPDRLRLSAGLFRCPRLSRENFSVQKGLEVLPYVHNLFEHLACSDLALVQGGLRTCMELAATWRRFLSFPLERHSGQCMHVTNRLHNDCADCSVRFRESGSGELAECALQAMHAPVTYKAVETDGAARAAREIIAVMENRAWASA